jgi:hypothetical protein
MERSPPEAPVSNAPPCRRLNGTKLVQVWGHFHKLAVEFHTTLCFDVKFATLKEVMFENTVCYDGKTSKN